MKKFTDDARGDSSSCVDGQSEIAHQPLEYKNRDG